MTKYKLPLDSKSIKKSFYLPNIIFNLGLSYAEIALYAYLRCCEDRTTYQCYPSYKTIGNAIGMSVNTVKKYVDSLVDKQLITVERTKVRMQNGTVCNGNMLYTIRPIQEAVDYYYRQQMYKLDQNLKREKAQEQLKKHPQKAV